MDVDALTPVAQDYVKAIWSATEWGEPPITTKALSIRFGTSPANVSDTMKRLAAQGLVDYAPYKPVQLTPLGAELAVVMVRKHRLIETFLVTIVGFGWDEVHDEAERLEHAASPLFIDRIDALLGHPTVDPHGDPIPDAAGRTAPPLGAILLRDAGVGTQRVHRISDEDPANLDAATRLGLAPGAVIEVRSADSETTILTASGEQRVPAKLAAATWVTRAD